MRKLISIVGLLSALIATEGLNRVATLVNVFNGKDGPIYSFILFVSIFAAGVLLVSLFARVARWVKVSTFIALLGGTAVLLGAPSFGVVMQSMGGLAVAAIGVLAINTRKVPLTSTAPPTGSS